MSKLYEIDGETLKLSFHTGQLKAWESNRRFIFVIAGSQGGKTSFGPFWLWREIQNRGPGDYLAVTSTYDLFKLKMLPEIRYIFEDVLNIGRYYAGEKIIELKDPNTGEFWAKRADDPMWGRIILRSSSAKGGLESSTAKGAWLDECGQPEFSVDSWEAIRRRLSLNEGRVLGTTTPYDLGWLKTTIVDRWAQGDPQIEVIQFPSILNPAFPQEEFESLRKTMPEWKFRMMFMGEFTRPAGMIFSDLVFVDRDHGGHLIDPFPIPQHWEVFVGIDPGAVNTGKVWLAKDPVSKVFYVFKTSIDGGKTIIQHTRDIQTYLGEKGLKLKGVCIGNRAEHQQRLDYRAAGISTIIPPKVYNVETGLDRLISIIKDHRLYIFKNCTNLIEELKGYSREVDSYGVPIPKIKDKGKYHLVDSLRYLSEVMTNSTGVFFA